MSFISNLWNSNNPIGSLVEAVTQAETHAIAGDNEHGKATLMRISALAFAIHKEVPFGNTMVDRETVTNLVRLWFPRTCYLNPFECNRSTTDEIWDGTQANNIVNRVCGTLHAYRYKNTFLGTKLPDGTIIGDSAKTRKDMNKALGYGKGKGLTQTIPVEVIRALDAIDRARANTKRAFKLACLHAFLDEGAVLLNRSKLEDDNGGLLVKDGWLMTVEHSDKKGRTIWLPSRGFGPDACVFIPPAASSQVIVIGQVSKGTNGQDQKFFRSSLEQFRSAWSESKVNAGSNEILQALKLITNSLNFDNLGMPEEELETAIANARSQIHAFELAVQQVKETKDRNRTSKDNTPVVTKDNPEPVKEGYKGTKNGKPVKAA